MMDLPASGMTLSGAAMPASTAEVPAAASTSTLAQQQQQKFFKRMLCFAEEEAACSSLYHGDELQQRLSKALGSWMSKEWRAHKVLREIVRAKKSFDASPAHLDSDKSTQHAEHMVALLVKLHNCKASHELMRIATSLTAGSLGMPAPQDATAMTAPPRVDQRPPVRPFKLNKESPIEGALRVELMQHPRRLHDLHAFRLHLAREQGLQVDPRYNNWTPDLQKQGLQWLKTAPALDIPASDLQEAIERARADFLRSCDEQMPQATAVDSHDKLPSDRSTMTLLRAQIDKMLAQEPPRIETSVEAMALARSMRNLRTHPNDSASPAQSTDADVARDTLIAHATLLIDLHAELHWPRGPVDPTHGTSRASMTSPPPLPDTTPKQ